MKITKILKNILTIFLIVMLLTSCQGKMDMKIPVDAALNEGFQYGLFQGFIVYPIGVLINFLTGIVGNAGLAMIITTIIVRSITLPVTIKGQVAMKATQQLQPKMQELEAKYKGRTDANAKNQKAAEMQQLYTSTGVNPFSSMLYPFLSMPLFFGTYRASMALEIFNKHQFLGFMLSKTPSEMIAKGEYVYVVLLVLVGVSQFAQFKISNQISQNRTKQSGARSNKQADTMNKQMQMMTYVFPFIMVFVALSLSSAMSLYLTTSALISIAQSIYIEKKMTQE